MDQRTTHSHLHQGQRRARSYKEIIQKRQFSYHTLKTKALRKKLQHQNGSTVSKYLKTWTKELPTLICTKDKEEQDPIKKSYKRDSSPPTIDS
jgi:hypothetical protein